MDRVCGTLLSCRFFFLAGFGGLFENLREYVICLVNIVLGGVGMAYLFFAFIFALLVAIFAIQNALPVTISFFAWNVQTSLVIIILGAATFGAMVIVSLATYVQFKQRLIQQKSKQRQSELEAEVKTLKTRLEQELAKDMTKNDL